ncbi:MAG: hypothetical protein AAF192_08205 [Pseudomonadota bacterium]
MSIRIESNLDQWRRGLDDFHRRRLPFALALALNTTATKLIAANRRHMGRIFDRPTRWTLNAFHFVRARAPGRLEVMLKRKSGASARHYLEVQAEGGTRPATGLETLLRMRLPYAGQVGRPVFTDFFPRDGNGNLQRGQLNRMLSEVRAQGDARNNQTAGSRKRSGRRYGYFISPPSWPTQGIYRRTSRDRIVPVVVFNGRRASYRKRYDFEGNMRRGSLALFPREVEAGMRQAVAIARARGWR